MLVGCRADALQPPWHTQHDMVDAPQPDELDAKNLVDLSLILEVREKQREAPQPPKILILPASNDRSPATKINYPHSHNISRPGEHPQHKFRLQSRIVFLQTLLPS